LDSETAETGERAGSRVRQTPIHHTNCGSCARGYGGRFNPSTLARPNDCWPQDDRQRLRHCAPCKRHHQLCGRPYVAETQVCLHTVRQCAFRYSKSTNAGAAAKGFEKRFESSGCSSLLFSSATHTLETLERTQRQSAITMDGSLSRDHSLPFMG
jgi:hypothetical protein